MRRLVMLAAVAAMPFTGLVAATPASACENAGCAACRASDNALNRLGIDLYDCPM